MSGTARPGQTPYGLVHDACSIEAFNRSFEGPIRLTFTCADGRCS